MELENQAAKQVYIKLLIEALNKKLEVLNQLLNITKEQENIIAAEVLNEDGVLDTINNKEVLILQLSSLDQGFEQVYHSVKEEFTENKYKYVAEITAMKEAILLITDVSIQLQALEQRNKSNLEVLLVQKRRDIKKSRVSSNTVAKYYKTMAVQNGAESFFYDKKK